MNDQITATPAVHAVKPVCAILDEPESYYVGWRNPETGEKGLGLPQWPLDFAEKIAQQFRVSNPQLEVWVGNVNDPIP